MATHWYGLQEDLFWWFPKKSMKKIMTGKDFNKLSYRKTFIKLISNKDNDDSKNESSFIPLEYFHKFMTNEIDHVVKVTIPNDANIFVDTNIAYTDKLIVSEKIMPCEIYKVLGFDDYKPDKKIPFKYTLKFRCQLCNKKNIQNVNKLFLEASTFRNSNN